MTLPQLTSPDAILTDGGIWIEKRGDQGQPVLLVAGLGDPAEAWTFQLDHLATTHRVAAFDNRGAGRSPLPAGELTVTSMADDAIEVMDTLGFDTAHVIGFSGGSVIAQELALRHDHRVDSLTLVGTWARADRTFRAMADAWQWMAQFAPSARAFYEAFFVWVYTHQAHESGFVAAMVDEALAFPHQQSVEAFHRQLDAFVAHDALDRLPSIDVPTLVVAGARDLICPPRLGRTVADAIPGARFELLPDQAHQPFQESPDEFHQLVRRFWHEIDTERALCGDQERRLVATGGGDRVGAGAGDPGHEPVGPQGALDRRDRAQGCQVPLDQFATRWVLTTVGGDPTG